MASSKFCGLNAWAKYPLEQGFSCCWVARKSERNRNTSSADPTNENLVTHSATKSCRQLAAAMHRPIFSPCNEGRSFGRKDGRL